MKTAEDIRKLLGVRVLSVKKHGKAPTAQAVTQFRQTLLADVKAISANGSAELIVAMEKALVQQPWRRPLPVACRPWIWARVISRQAVGRLIGYSGAFAGIEI